MQDNTDGDDNHKDDDDDNNIDDDDDDDDDNEDIDDDEDDDDNEDIDDDDDDDDMMTLMMMMMMMTNMVCRVLMIDDGFQKYRNLNCKISTLRFFTFGWWHEIASLVSSQSLIDSLSLCFRRMVSEPKTCVGTMVTTLIFNSEHWTVNVTILSADIALL